jgi:Leucine-rich repeat (LRR) protein/ribosomal 50S subunit-recycling heat shock protein
VNINDKLVKALFYRFYLNIGGVGSMKISRSKNFLSTALATSMLLGAGASAIPADVVVVGDDVFSIGDLEQDWAISELNEAIFKSEEIYYSISGITEELVSIEDKSTISEENKKKLVDLKLHDEGGNVIQYSDVEAEKGKILVKDSSSLKKYINDSRISEVVLDADIELENVALEVKQMVNIDLNGKKLKGELKFDANQKGKIKIKSDKPGSFIEKVSSESGELEVEVDDNVTIEETDNVQKPQTSGESEKPSTPSTPSTPIQKLSVEVESKADFEKAVENSLVEKITIKGDFYADLTVDDRRNNDLVIDLQSSKKINDIRLDTDSNCNIKVVGNDDAEFTSMIVDMENGGAECNVDVRDDVVVKAIKDTFVMKGKAREIIVEGSSSIQMETENGSSKPAINIDTNEMVKLVGRVGEINLVNNKANLVLETDSVEKVIGTTFDQLVSANKAMNLEIEGKIGEVKIAEENSVLIGTADVAKLSTQASMKVDTNGRIDRIEILESAQGKVTIEFGDDISVTEIVNAGDANVELVNSDLVVKNKQKAPNGVSIQRDGNSFKLANTTSEMEYATASDASPELWTQCGDGETPVSSGTYYVRYAASESNGNTASAIVKIVAEIIPNDSLRKLVVACLNKSSYRVDGAEWTEQDPETYKPSVEDIKKLKKIYSWRMPDTGDEKDINDLEGLQYAENLEAFNFSNGGLNDVSQLKNLPKLTKLMLSGNKIKDLRAIQGMSSITYLNLAKNGVREVVDLSSLTSLEELYLDNNEIENLANIGNIPNLTTLDVGYNKIKNLNGIENLTKVNDLNAVYNEISDISSLRNLTELKKLLIYNNNISDMSALSNLTKLEEFEIMYNKLTDVSALSGITSLKHLSIRNNKIYDISSLSNLTNLEYFHIYENEVEDISILRNMTKITEFNFSRNNVKDITPISNLPLLSWLYGYENEVEDIAPAMTLPKLTTLNLQRNSVLDLRPLKDKVKYQGEYGEAYKDIIITGGHRVIRLDPEKDIDFEKQNKHWVVQTKNPVRLSDGSFVAMKDVKNDGSVVKTITKSEENDTVEIKIPLENSNHSIDIENKMSLGFLCEKGIPFEGWDAVADGMISGREFSGSVDFVIPAGCDVICTRLIIQRLPELSDITLNDKDAVKAARVAYTFLRQDTNKDLEDAVVRKLRSAEQRIAELEKTEPKIVKALYAARAGKLTLNFDKTVEIGDAEVDETKISINGVSLTENDYTADSGQEISLVITLSEQTKTALSSKTAPYLVSVESEAFRDLADNKSKTTSLTAEIENEPIAPSEIPNAFANVSASSQNVSFDFEKDGKTIEMNKTIVEDASAYEFYLTNDANSKATITGAAYDVNTKKVTLTFANPMNSGTYTLKLVKSLKTAIDGNVDKDQFNSATNVNIVQVPSDTTPPTVSGSTNTQDVDNSENLSSGDILYLTFNEAIKINNLSASDFEIKDALDQDTVRTLGNSTVEVDSTSGNKKIKITLGSSSDVKVGDQITLAEANKLKITDVAGNPVNMTADSGTKVAISRGSEDKPEIVSASYKDANASGKVDSGDALVVTFNKKLEESSITGLTKDAFEVPTNTDLTTFNVSLDDSKKVVTLTFEGAVDMNTMNTAPELEKFENEMTLKAKSTIKTTWGVEADNTQSAIEVIGEDTTAPAISSARLYTNADTSGKEIEITVSEKINLASSTVGDFLKSSSSDSSAENELVLSDASFSANDVASIALDANDPTKIVLVLQSDAGNDNDGYLIDGATTIKFYDGGSINVRDAAGNKIDATGVTITVE